MKYPNDGKVDYMLLEDGMNPGDGYGWLTFKGEMQEEKVPVVFSWPDADDGEINATVYIVKPKSLTLSDIIKHVKKDRYITALKIYHISTGSIPLYSRRYMHSLSH